MAEMDTTFDSRYDARILADAAKINADPARLAAAQGAANEILRDNEIETAALKSFAKKIYGHDTSVAAREKRETVV